MCVLLLPLLAIRAFAVEPGKPSRTAVATLAARVIGARDPDPATRNPDLMAERLLGPDELALLGPDHIFRKALSTDYRQAMEDRAVAIPVAYFLVRTRFIDDGLTRAVRAGATQVVILGAGFDSRAYRLRRQLRHAKVFEVDYGPTQAFKKRRALAALGPPPSNLVYVPIDFTREQLGEVLLRAGYQPRRKTFFIWEGVTMYIPEEAVRATLQFVARRSASGSAIVFDHLSSTAVDAALAPESRRPFLDRMRAQGEPQIFGLAAGTEQAFVSSVGLTLVRHVFGVSRETRKYLTRRDGTIIGDPQWPLAAGDLPKPMILGLASAGIGWLAVAEVPQRQSRLRTNDQRYTAQSLQTDTFEMPHRRSYSWLAISATR
jgi:methyltransferase (TIGR00027 family)